MSSFYFWNWQLSDRVLSRQKCGIVAEWLTHRTSDLRIAGRNLSSNTVRGKRKKLNTHCLVLVGSRNEFECFNKLIASNIIKLK
jgi:hypothetical protein